MNTSIRKKVFELVKVFIGDKPNGANYSSIIKYLKQQLPDVSVDTLHALVWHSRQKIIKGKEKEITLPDRGLYILTKYYSQPVKTAEKIGKKIKEKEFYPSFADYLLRFGIGLILFDAENPEEPKYEIRTGAIKSEPDYYLNQYLFKLPRDKQEELLK